MKHEFAYLVKENAVPFTLKPKASGGYGDDGRPLPNIPKDPIEMSGIVLPLTNRDLQYATNGTYTKSDRKVIVLSPIEIKSTVTYKGRDYAVQEESDWDVYSDFYVYICRRADK